MNPVVLQKAIERAYSLNLEVGVFKLVHNLKKWMEPHVPPMHDHLKEHALKFIKKEGITLMFYKEWSIDGFWLPNASNCKQSLVMIVCKL